MGGSISLEAGKEEVFSDSACKFTGPNSIFPFAFRTHSHSLGKFINPRRVGGLGYSSLSVCVCVCPCVRVSVCPCVRVSVCLCSVWLTW